MKCIRLSILSLLVMLTEPLLARQHQSYVTDNNHYFGIYADGGYSRMQPWKGDVTVANGYGASAGILYEYEHNSFICNLGCGFAWRTGGWGLTDPIEMAEDATDSQGKQYTLHTHIVRNDVVQRAYVTVPVMFGGSFGRCYMLGGIKAGIGVLDYSYMQASVSTYGEYDRYFGPIHDASNHALRTDVDVRNTWRPVSNIDVQLSYECGVWLNTTSTSAREFKARLALFADYGIFACQYRQNDHYIGDIRGNYDFSTYELQPILLSGKDTFLGHLMAGAKLTLLIGGSTNYQYNCPTCNVLDNQLHRRSRQKRCATCMHFF